MKNIAFICLIVGAVVLVFGFHEYQVADGAEFISTTVSLGAIESNGYLDKKHIAIEEHWKIYPYIIYSFKGVVGQNKAEDYNKILHAYYPVVSSSHPFMKELSSLAEEYGGQDKIPEHLWPKLNEFSMLVKTKEFQRISDFPENIEKGGYLAGVIMNDYSWLSAEERELIQGAFPGLKLDRVKLLDQGRQPMPGNHIVILMGVGGVLLMFSMGLFVLLIFGFFKKMLS